MNQHYGLDDMDYGELAAKMKLIAIDEMRHAEMFAERIKELGGEPCTSYEGNLHKGQDVHSIYPMIPSLKMIPLTYTVNSYWCAENMETL